jgi:ABC-type glycerol-3-phosphate transport system substrate-binding protein
MIGVPVPDQAVFEAAERLLRRLEHVHGILADPDLNSVRVVMNLEKMSIVEAQRSFTYFHLYGYPSDLDVANKVIPAGATSWDDTSNNKAWLGSQAASIFNSGSIINTMMTDAQYKTLLADSSFAPFPLKDKLGVTMGGFNAFGVMATSKNQDLARSIVIHAMSKERYIGYMKSAQGMFFSALVNQSKDDFYTKDPVLSQVAALSPFARQNYEPGDLSTSTWIAELGDTWSFSRMLAPVATGQKSVKDAVAELAKRAETVKAKWDKVSQ